VSFHSTLINLYTCCDAIKYPKK